LASYYKFIRALFKHGIIMKIISWLCRVTSSSFPTATNSWKSC